MSTFEKMKALKANAKQAIKEIVKETLRMAAENAKISTYFVVDKDSITNVINKIKF